MSPHCVLSQYPYEVTDFESIDSGSKIAAIITRNFVKDGYIAQSESAVKLISNSESKIHSPDCIKIEILEVL